MNEEEAVEIVLKGTKEFIPDVANILRLALIQLAKYDMKSGSWGDSRLRSKLRVLELACIAGKVASKTYGEDVLR